MPKILFIACGALAFACGRSQAVTRRNFLQRGLQGAAIVSLMPGVGYSVISELLAPSELEAFDEATLSLNRLAMEIGRGEDGSRAETIPS